MAASYGYVYVAQVAMGANMNQFIKALKEAEAYHGPSLIIAYAPCINLEIKGGMKGAQTRIKEAVECGYCHAGDSTQNLKLRARIHSSLILLKNLRATSEHSS